MAVFALCKILKKGVREQERMKRKNEGKKTDARGRSQRVDSEEPVHAAKQLDESIADSYALTPNHCRIGTENVGMETPIHLNKRFQSNRYLRSSSSVLLNALPHIFFHLFD